jgi:1,4-dihydroxy-2-naphthoate octaprenyltransferase
MEQFFDTNHNSYADAGDGATPGVTAIARLKSLPKILRYRFFVVAGILPYTVGAAVAYHMNGSINWWLYGLGLLGVFFVGAGIEGMNEHFDFLKGGDRVFAGLQRSKVGWHLPVGLTGMSLALLIGLILSLLRGPVVMGFAAFGGLLALAYLCPPVRLSYRGAGELAIAIGYGPGLIMGGYCLHGEDWWNGNVLWASLLVGLAVLAIALANEVPDYYGDRLVGKKNLVVRIGRRRGAILCAVVLSGWFLTLLFGLLIGRYPPLLILLFGLLPMAYRGARAGLKYYDVPVQYVKAIRANIVLFAIACGTAIVAYVTW